MIEIKTLKDINSLDDLDKLGIGVIDIDISYRGGILGFHGIDVANHIDIEPNMLPRKFGAYCNYLGGGVRGSIQCSTFSSSLKPPKSEWLEELAAACKRVYEILEDDSGMNDELDDEDETNWEALGTKTARDSGIVSAY
jgi:hypothetical protein